MGVTIKDIARVANVSHTTVSRALNDSEFINEETKKKIKKIAEELNYVPNYNAKGLVTLKSNNIGIFFSSLDKGTSFNFFHEVISGINKAVNNKYNLIIKGIDEWKNHNDIDSRNFAGIIVVSQSKKDDDFIKGVMEKQIPMVIINRVIFQENIVNILSNDTKGVYDAIEYLIGKGHRKIAMIEGNSEFESTLYRKRGYMRALEDNDIIIEENLVLSGEYSLKSGYENMEKLLELEEKPTAVFCANDDIAFGAIRAIRENNLVIPANISVVGFDNSNFCDYSIPSLTSIKKKSYEMSEKGAEKLLQIIKGENIEIEKIYIETELVIRESVSEK